jgi:nucleotide-binding universal stress UspA family protein
MKILATLDGSKESLAVLEPLQMLAQECQPDIALLTVVVPPAAVPREPGAVDVILPGGALGTVTAPTMRVEAILQPGEPKWAESPDQAIARVEAEARDALADAAKRLPASGGAAEKTVLMAEDPAAAIVGFAREWGADLIAMATHGRTGLREVVQGSVAAAVLRTARVPVLMVRPRG